MQREDDEVWKGIVDNYGDRVELEPDDAGTPDPVTDTVDVVDTRDDLDDELGREAARRDHPASAEASWQDPYVDADWTSDRFVPPEPPPIPPTTQDRFLAWVGLFGAPAALLLCLVLGVSLPAWVPLLLVTAFAAGFIYLVVTMSHEPRDPGDDGAVL